MSATIPPGDPLRGLAIRAMQSTSRRELHDRSGELVRAVEAVAGPLRFVNAGGTGSLESSSAEPWVTEVTAGSGLFGPALFDDYTRFRHGQRVLRAADRAPPGPTRRDRARRGLCGFWACGA